MRGAPYSASLEPLLSDTGAVELRNEIGRVLGVELPGTLIFDYPTISAMSTMLAAKLSPTKAAPMQEPPSRRGRREPFLQ